MGVFSWLTGKETTEPTRGYPRRPSNKDLTGGLVANEEMLRGLYHGNYAGLQFAAPLCFAPINVLTHFVGFPTPQSDDPRTQEVLDELMLLMKNKITRIHRGCFISGNAWRWPRYDAKTGVPVWEAIPDSIVTDILADVATERINKILTHEKIALSVRENTIVYVERKRTFDDKRVEVKWMGARPEGVEDYTALNVSGILPINFMNDADEGAYRGYSQFARVIRDLKDYHDTDYRISETLTKFKPKQKQTVVNLGDWLMNNFGSKDATVLTEYDISGNDLVINTKEETTDYDFLPEGATAALEKALERKFWKVVEGTGIPELFWGPLATGNHASTETQMEQAVAYAESKRQDMSPAYERLIQGTLNVLSVARMENYAPFTMAWNKLESVSEAVKSQIFLRFADAVSKLVATATITKKQIYTLWEMQYPDVKPDTYKEYIEGMAEMAMHNQFNRLDYFTGLEDTGAAEGEKDDADDSDADGE